MKGMETSANRTRAAAATLFVATVLTLLFLPALYAAWFQVRKPGPPYVDVESVGRIQHQP